VTCHTENHGLFDHRGFDDVSPSRLKSQPRMLPQLGVDDLACHFIVGVNNCHVFIVISVIIQSYDSHN
jgi:hypothetical protein